MVTSEGTKVEKLEGTKVEKIEGTRVVTTEGVEVPTVSELVVGLPTVAKAPWVSTTEKMTPANVSVEKRYLRKQLTKNGAEDE